MTNSTSHITQAAYAQRRGVSREAVSRAVKAGRITALNGLIDPAVADIQWAQNTRARAPSGASLPLTGTATDPASGARLAQPGGEGDPQYWQSRGRREKAEADLAELKLAEQLGLLVRAADVKAVYARKAAGLREAILQLPARLSPVLAAESDAARVHELLLADLRVVLEQVTQVEH